MEFRILGPLEVIDDAGTPLRLPRGRGRALLALLILHAGQVVSTDRLIDELWGEGPPATAKTALEGLVSGLRKLLEPSRLKTETPNVLQTHSPGYLLAADADQVDALRFRRLLKEAADASGHQRNAIVRAALGLWRGPALTDFAYQPFAQAAITALEELRIAAVEERIDADLATGRHRELVAELEGLVAEYPLREGLRGQLMLALYRAGRQAEALDVYRNLQRTLVEELGVEPGPAVQGLEGAILRQDPSLDPSPPESLEREAVEKENATGTPWLPPGRKTVTVVFADLAPVEVDGRLDPEARRLITGRGYDIATRAFTRHGGTVEGLIGEVVVAVFGVPVAHEDDAFRAVRAAVELRQQLRELNKELDGEWGTRLAARVGIDTGEVVVGRPGIRGPSASGDTVSVAARLQQTAATEEVLVGEATRRLVGDAARVESVGTAAPGLLAWRLTGLVADPAAVLLGADTRMVGRDEELARLRAVFVKTVRDQHAALVPVLGEAGIGKSRLAREFASLVEPQALVLTGHCPAYGEGITFWPLREIVLQALDKTGADSIADLLSNEDDAPSAAAQVAGAIGLTEELGRRQGLFKAFCRLFEALASKQPLVVAFEDVHWAQSTFLDLVDYLADSVHKPTMLLCLARPELRDQRRAWTDSATSLFVEPLGHDESAKLVADRSADGAMSAELATRVLEAAQGNPLFVEQLVAALHDDGTLAIPASVEALLAARLDRLGPAERDLLRCASVAGMQFSAEVLRALVPTEVRRFVVRHLEALRDKELIRPTDGRFLADPAWSFRHILIQLASYRSITRQARSELHERLAGWLESEGSGSVAYDEIIGHHLERACLDRRHLGLSDKHTHGLAIAAGERLAGAGLRAFARFDAAAAENLLSRATALLPSTHPRRLEVRSRLAEAYTVMGRHHDADAVLSELQEELDPGDGKSERFIRIERAGILLATGPDPASLDAVRHEATQMLVASEQASDQAGIAHALFVLAVVHLRSGEVGAMEKVARRTIAHADRSGSAREELGARLVLALALESGPAPVSECIRELERLVRWRDTEHPSLLSTLAHLRAMRGQFDQAREFIGRSRRLLMEQTTARRPLGLLSEHGAAVEILAGDLDAAERHLRVGLELNLAMAERERIALIAAILSWILSLRGDREEAVRMVYLSRHHAPSESVVAQARWRAAMARVAANRHDPVGAEQFARQAVDLAPPDMLNLAAELRLNLAEILVESGRDDASRPLIDQATELYERKGNLVGAARAGGLDLKPAPA